MAPPRPAILVAPLMISKEHINGTVCSVPLWTFKPGTCTHYST